MSINHFSLSTVKILALFLVSLLPMLAPDAMADNIPEAKGPCGSLTPMGQHTGIYNNSRYRWDVIFRTKDYAPRGGARSVNAGAVKYLSNGMWIDSGIGDYRHLKTYTIPVEPDQNLRIAYCADTSNGDAIIFGEVLFLLKEDSDVHGSPASHVEFSGLNLTPNFKNHGNTAYVDYNKNRDGVIEAGSLTICPYDVDCKIP